MTRFMFVFLVACGGASVEAPSPVVAPEPVVAPPPEPPVADAAKPALERVVRGEASIGDLVDASQGVVHVIWATDASGLDPRADESGIIRLGERVCGAELAELVTYLDRDLGNRTDTTWDCADDSCEHPAAMEYDLSGRYRFERGDPVRLISVVRIETGVTEDALTQAREFVRDQLATLENGTCDGVAL